MTALDFPNSPTVGESFVGPSGKQWVWSGTRWQAAQETVLTTSVEYVKNLVAGTGISLSNNSGTAAQPTVAVNTSTIATKTYVDAVAAGINWHEAVRLATAAALGNSPTYNNGTGGVGATLTATTLGRLSVDGANASTGNRVLVKNQANAHHNGIYVVTEQGNSFSTYWILTRAADFDGSPGSEINAGEAVFVTDGSANFNQGFVLTSQGTGTDNAHVILTDDITFSQFTGTSTLVAGSGLSKTGNQIDIGTASASRIVVNSDDIDLATVAQSNTSGSATTSFLTGVTVDSYGRVSGQATANVSFDSALVKSKFDAKGDLVVGTGNDSYTRIGLGTNGFYLKANNATATGLEWGALPGVSTIDDVGDVTITSAVSGDFLKWNGSAWINDPINLGTDTVGDFVSSLVAGTGVSLSNNSGEGSTPTVSIGQAVGTGSSPTFAGGTVGNLRLGITAVNEIDTTSGNLILDSTGGTVQIDDDVTIAGNLTVNGTTLTVNSTTLTVDDPIVTLGGDTAPSSDDNKDRGVEFRWHNGTAARVGFFGFDDSTGKFTFIPDASNTSEVFSGTLGTIDVGDIHISGTASTGTGGVARSVGPTFTGTVILPTTTQLLEDYLSITSNTTLSVASHSYKAIEVNSTSNLTITVPTNASQAFPIGTVITIIRVNTGEVTIAGDTGVTVNNSVGNRLRDQWSTATLRKRATDTWLLSGDIKV